jgi:hypothetical protein
MLHLPSGSRATTSGRDAARPSTERANDGATGARTALITSTASRPWSTTITK